MFLNLMKGLIRFGSIVLYLPLYDDFIVPYVSLSSYDAFFTLPVAWKLCAYHITNIPVSIETISTIYVTAGLLERMECVTIDR